MIATVITVIATMLAAQMVSAQVAAAAPAPAAGAPASAVSYPQAVVLVSGVESLTPFSTPDPSCAGQEGSAWSPEIAPTLRSANLAVFTAPVAPNSASNPSCTAGGPDVTPAMEINSDGDVNANGLALANFLSFLVQDYGVRQIQIVSHSDGGLWSRSAITQELAVSAAAPAIMSLTTIGTPETGSFVADVGTQASNFPCTDTVRCAVIHAIANKVFQDLGKTALYELSSPYLMTWNPQQQIKSCPVTAIGGTADNDTKFFAGASLYYNPSDGLVGEASALNEDAAALDGSDIPPAAGLNIVTTRTFPDYHTPALGSPDELSDPAVAAVALAAVQAGSSTSCNGATVSSPPVGPPTPPPPPPPLPPTPPPPPPTGPVTVGLPLHIADVPDRHGRLPKSRAGDVVITVGRHARVSCRGRKLASQPLRGDRELRVTRLHGCRQRLTVRHGRAVLLRLVHGARLQVVLNGARIHIRVRQGHLRDLRADVRIGRRWRRLAIGRHGRATLPRHATALRVSGRLKDGQLASSVAFISR